MAHDINGETVKIIEQCQVAPPPTSLPSITLPLTFFDIIWFLCPTVQHIFFYHFPYPTHHFLQTALPILKHSLSVTLQHFFPFASNLTVPPQLHHSYIRYLDGDSLSFTVAESTADFALLTSDSPQDVRNLHPLVPTLPSPRIEEDGTRVFPLMAIQVTVLPNSGFGICVAFNHLAGDGKSLHHFIKFWASVCKAKGDLASLKGSLSLPSHERERVRDPKGLKLFYSQEIGHGELKSHVIGFGDPAQAVYTNKLRFTVVLSREQVEKLKKWVSLKCATRTSGTSHISTFVVTCSLIWHCLIKSEKSECNYVGKECNEEFCCITILADCRDHPDFLLPSTYFGNCLVFCYVMMKRSEVVGENGMVEVANAVERQVRDFKSHALTKVERMLSCHTRPREIMHIYDNSCRVTKICRVRD